jgi:hypothetical protein
MTLVSYDAGVDVESVVAQYLASPDLLGDLDGFDPSQILAAEDIALEPTPGSPLS